MALSKDEIKNLISDNLQSGTKITATKHREVENALMEVIFALSDSFNHFVTTEALPYEVREIDMNTNLISVYFEMGGSSPGRGKAGSPFEKWAICNSHNGTKDRHGKTSIGYGFGRYDDLGKTGGDENAIVVSHNHTTLPATQMNGENAASIGEARWSNSGSNAASQNVTLGTTTVGESGAGKNMQPYIVTLFIQRIPTVL